MEDCPGFGVAEAGRDYRLRAGAYALIRSAQGLLAMVEGASGHFFLPGGGAEPGETLPDTLRREALEECGWRIGVGRKLGEARQYVDVPAEGHFLLHCHYYEAAIVDRAEAGPAHRLRWADAGSCANLLHRDCDRWAVTQLGQAPIR
jgi:8-oxo-dGTP diphosphatase